MSDSANRSGDSDVHVLAAAQHGVVAKYQLRVSGWQLHEIDGLCRYHGWESVTSRVLRRVGSPATPGQRACAAVLDTGPAAYLSHESAAAWFGHRGCRLERPVHVVTVRKTTRPSPLAKVHRVRRIDSRWVTDIGGIPVVRPELVALHLFAIHSYGRAERIVESLWAQRLLSGRSIQRLLEDLGRSGRNGTAGLRRFLDARGVAYDPPDTSLESRTQQVLGNAGIKVRRQINLGGEAHWSGRVDFVVLDVPLVIEVQSELHHSSLTDRADDVARIQRLNADGFVVVEVTDEMVWTDRYRVVELVQSGIRQAAAMPRSRFVP